MMSFLRFFKVWAVLAKYRIDLLLPHTPFNFIVTFLVFLMPTAWHKKKSMTNEVRIRQALEELGPIFVKFGQAVSTRPDLLSPEMAKELAKLQDKVEPFSNEVSVKIIEDAIRQPVSEAFQSFDNKVLASASIAQVHAATLKTGEDVVVKVVRPAIRKVIRSDIRLMYFFAHLINSLSKEVKRLRLPEVVAEFDKTIDGELDLLQEAANASVLRSHFENSEILYVPKVHWDFCSKNVLVLERIYGVSIGDIETLRENKVDLKKLAARGVEIFFTQVFFNQYFHADMHPGNIFVDITDPQNPRYLAVDFGIMGSLNDDDQYYLAENFLAFFNRDYRRVAKLHIDSGWIPSHVKVSDFESAIRKASEPIFGKPLKEISFAQFLLTLFQTARRFEMEVQPQLVLLEKTFFNIEGLGRVLYPDLDLWDTGKPILEKWMKEEFGIKSVYKKFRSHAGEYKEIIPKLPLLINQHLQSQKQLKQNQSRQLAWGILLGALVIAVVQPDLWGGELTRGLGITAIILLLWKLLRKNKI